MPGTVLQNILYNGFIGEPEDIIEVFQGILRIAASVRATQGCNCAETGLAKMANPVVRANNAAAYIERGSFILISYVFSLGRLPRV